MKKIFIALTLFATMSLGTYAMPRKGNIDPKFGRMPMKELNLSSEQQSKVQTLNKEFRAKAEALRNDTTLNREDKARQRKELRQSRQEAFQAVLTPEQQTTWKEMKEKAPQRNDRKFNRKRMEFKDRSPMAKLNLTEDQKTKIQAINKEYRDKQKDLNKAKRDEISSILTPEQQQMMKDNRKHFAGKDKPGKRHQRPNRTDKDIK